MFLICGVLIPSELSDEDNRALDVDIEILQQGLILRSRTKVPSSSDHPLQFRVIARGRMSGFYGDFNAKYWKFDVTQ